MAAAKKTARKKSTAKKSTAKKSTAKKSTAKKSTAKKSTATKKTAAKKTASGGYTKPALRERIKKRIGAGTKGGAAGQWSARKAQLLASEYEKAGGGYTRSRRTESQRHLEHWHDPNEPAAAKKRTTTKKSATKSVKRAPRSGR